MTVQLNPDMFAQQVAPQFAETQLSKIQKIVMMETQQLEMDVEPLA